MDFPVWLKIVLLSGMGVCWTLTYLLIIYRSWKDKTYGMPFIALSLNICWEFFYAFVFVSPTLTLQVVFNRFWFVLDLFILVFYFLYGKKDWRYPLYKKWFYTYSFSVLITAGVLIWLFEFDMQETAITYSAFMMNVIISASFLQMILHRNSLSGQSFGIAVFKLIGTLCATIFLFDGFTNFLILLGLICFILDAVYLFFVIRLYKHEQLHLITRKPYQYFEGI